MENPSLFMPLSLKLSRPLAVFIKSCCTGKHHGVNTSDGAVPSLHGSL